MAIGTAGTLAAARCRVRVSQFGWPLCLVLALWPLPVTALEPLYGGLGDFEVTLARNSVQDTLEHMASREIRRWSFAGSQTRGSVMPLRTFKIKSGHYCREFREVVSSAANGVHLADQTACRNDAGQWVRVEP